MRRDAGQLMQEATSSALTVRVGLLGIVPPRLIPAVWLDADKRGDVQRIVTAHRDSGSGDAETFWLYTESGFFLHCALLRPLESAFWIAFPFPRWREFLILVMRLGSLVVFTDQPPAWTECSGACNPFALVPEEEQKFVEGFALSIGHPELPAMLRNWPMLW